MEREAVVFYKSFDEAISLLPDEDQLKAYRAIIRYGLYGETPQLYGEGSDVTGIAGAIFLLAKPQIDANNRKYENGKKGGRPAKTEDKANKKQSITEEKPNGKQGETQKEKEKEKEKEKNNISSKIEDIFETVWKAYPEKKGKGKVSDKDKRKIAEIGVDKMLLAIQRYKDDVKSTNWKHWQNGSTFFHSGYIDYLDENYERSNQSRPPNGFNNAAERSCDMNELEFMLLQSN